MTASDRVLPAGTDGHDAARMPRPAALSASLDPSRLDADGQFVPVDATSPGAFVQALVTTTPCFATATEACSSQACALQVYVAAVPGLSDGLRTTLSAAATAACTQAGSGDYAAAVAALDAFLSHLAQALTAGTVAKGLSDDLSWRALDARAVLARVPTVAVTGTWVGSLPLAAGPRPVALQLHLREDGRVLGYALGAADAITVTDGWVGLDVLHLSLSVRDTAQPRDVLLSLRVQTSHPAEGPDVTTAAGTLQDGAAAQAASLTLTDAPLAERRFVLLGGAGGAIRSEVALAVDGTGALVAGGFASTDCAFLGCGGEVYALAEDPVTGRLWLFFRTGDGAAGHVDADFDGDHLYQPASWQAQSPGQAPVTGVLVGFRATGTSSAHAAVALHALGRLADDLQARHDFTQHVAGTAHESIDPEYRHDGLDAAGLLSSLATEVALYDALDVSLGTFGNLRSVDPANVHALGRVAPGIDFHDRRVGTADGTPVVYRDAGTTAPDDGLRHLRFDPEADTAVLVGNGYPQDTASPGAWPFRLPFAPSDIRDLLVGVSGFVPYGVLGKAGGAEWFRFRFAAAGDAPEVRAMTDSEVVFVSPGTVSREVTMYARTASHVMAFRGIIPDASLSDLPLQVQAGAPLGVVPDDAWAPDGTRAMDLFVGNSADDPICPYWLLGESDQALLLRARNAHPYPQELVEPFVCNELPTAGASLPRVLTWTLDGAATPQPGNPRAIRFTHVGYRQDDSPVFTCDLLDAAGNVLWSGDVTQQVFTTSPVPHWVLTMQPAFGTDLIYHVAIQVRSPLDARMTLWRDGPAPLLPDGYRPSTLASLFDCPDDGNFCTDEVSLRPPLCKSIPNDLPCSGLDACTVGARCDESGACVGGAPRDCDDGDPCTLDGCTELTGICTHLPRDCDDGDPATADFCQSCTGCVNWRDPENTPCAPTTDCSDSDPGTDDRCVLGRCAHIILPGPIDGACDPGTDSLGDLCNQGVLALADDLVQACRNRCAIRPVPPPMGCDRHCQDVTLSAISGACRYGCDFPAIPSNPECVQQPRPEWCEKTCQVDATATCCTGNEDCNDYSACNTHWCDQGRCRITADPFRCLPSDACHFAACDPYSGTCVDQPRDCDDGDPCTIDSCDPCDLVTGPCHHVPIGGCGPEPSGDQAPAEDVPVIDTPDAQEGEDASVGPDTTYTDPGTDGAPLDNEPIDTQCGPGSVTAYDCGVASCGDAWLGFDAYDLQGSDVTEAFVLATQAATLSFNPVSPNPVWGAALSVAPSGSAVVAYVSGPASASAFSVQVYTFGLGMTSRSDVTLASPVQFSGVLPNNVSRRDIDILALDDQQFLVWGERPVDVQASFPNLPYRAHYDLVGQRYRAEQNGAWVASPWNSGVGISEVVPEGRFPSLAIDRQNLNAVAVYSQLRPRYPEGHALHDKDDRVDTVGVDFLNRGCLSDNFTLRQGTLRAAGRCADPSPRECWHVWKDHLRVATLRDGRYVAAWIYHDFDSGNDQPYRIEYWPFPATDSMVTWPIRTPHQLSAEDIQTACNWCPSEWQDTQGNCLRWFPDPSQSRPFVLAAHPDPLEPSAVMAFSVDVLEGKRIVVLRVDMQGRILRCAVHPMATTPTELKLLSDSAHVWLFFNNSVPGGSASPFAFMRLDSTTLAASTGSWPVSFNPTSFSSPGNAFLSPLTGSSYVPMMAVAAPGCCETPATMMSFSQTLQRIDVTRFVLP